MRMPHKNKKLHIVHIIPTLRHGGAERLVVDLSNALAKNGHRVSIVTFFDDIPLASELDKNVEVHIVKKKGKLSLGLISALPKKLLEIDADIVHTHLFGADVWGRLAAKKLHLPVVSTEHNINKSEGILKHQIKRMLRKKTDQYVAVSQSVAVYMRERYSIQEDYIDIIPPGIDIKKFQELSQPEWSDITSILMLGRLTEQKGFDIAVKALAGLQELDWTCQIVGNGEEEQELQRQIRTLGLEERITMSQATTDVGGVYTSADIVLMPSRWEGFGMVALEAMAAGRLLIGSRVGGLPDMIQDKENGVLFEPNNEESLQKALLWTFDHGDEAKRMARRAKDHVESFDIAHMVEAYTKIYQELV